MMRRFLIPALAGASLLLSGCIAKTALDIVTLPVKAGSQVADWATTSQSESDRNYGKRMRERDAREGRERKKHDQACRRDPASCGAFAASPEARRRGDD